MLIRDELYFVKIGAIGIMILMLAAMITHFRVKNLFAKMVPSIVLFGFCSLILFGT
jgi:hypothetical protein